MFHRKNIFKIQGGGWYVSFSTDCGQIGGYRAVLVGQENILGCWNFPPAA
jgi:hypothetical protein